MSTMEMKLQIIDDEEIIMESTAVNDLLLLCHRMTECGSISVSIDISIWQDLTSHFDQDDCQKSSYYWTALCSLLQCPHDHRLPCRKGKRMPRTESPTATDAHGTTSNSSPTRTSPRSSAPSATPASSDATYASTPTNAPDASRGLFLPP